MHRVQCFGKDLKNILFSIVKPWSSLGEEDEGFYRPKRKSVVFMTNRKNMHHMQGIISYV